MIVRLKGKLNWKAIIIIRQIEIWMQIAPTVEEIILNLPTQLQFQLKLLLWSQSMNETVFRDVISQLKSTTKKGQSFTFYGIRWHLKNVSYSKNAIALSRKRRTRNPRSMTFECLWFENQNQTPTAPTCRRRRCREEKKNTNWRLLVVT